MIFDGPFGSAYCESCQRLVDLVESGKLIEHTRSYVEYGRWHNATCRGSGELPVDPPEENDGDIKGTPVVR